MMNGLELEKDSKINMNVINLFRLKKIDNYTIKDVRNLVRLKKEIDDKKIKIIRNFKKIFKLKKCHQRQNT